MVYHHPYRSIHTIIFSNYLKSKESELFSNKSTNRTIKIKTKKITVALPIMNQESQQDGKISENAIKNDFLAKYVGSTIRAWKSTIDEDFEIALHTEGIMEDNLANFGYMTGMLRDLGLVNFRRINTNSDEIAITLTKKGLKFLIIKNPILDENNFLLY